MPVIPAFARMTSEKARMTICQSIYAQNPLSFSAGPKFKNLQMRDLIFISLESWDEIWRRNQFICAGLARRFPEMKILFVEPPRDVSHQMRKRDLAPLRTQATRILPDFPNITITRPLKLLPNSLKFGQRVNQRLAQKHLRNEARKLKMEKPRLWINSHSDGQLAGKLGESAVVYDITDDWTQFGSAYERAMTTAQDEYLCRRADLTIVCSQSLLETRQKRSRKILHLPNGVHVEHYQNLEKYTQFQNRWPAPVFGYTGTLHPERTDANLISDVARAFPEGSVVLVGPEHYDAPTHQKWKLQKNIHLVGAVPYAEIPQYMAAFDVCMVPHCETAFTQSLNPIKLWEYLASGKPVASTNVAGFRDFSDLCHIGSGEDAFLSACREALSEKGDGKRAQQRREIAKNHSWDARLDELVKALEGLAT